MPLKLLVPLSFLAGLLTMAFIRPIEIRYIPAPPEAPSCHVVKHTRSDGAYGSGFWTCEEIR